MYVIISFKRSPPILFHLIFLFYSLCLHLHNFQAPVFYVLFCTIICIIFTSLCKKLVKLTRVFSRSFLVPCEPVSMFNGHGGTPSFEIGANGTEKLLLKTLHLLKILESEGNLIIHYGARSRWTKYKAIFIL